MPRIHNPNGGSHHSGKTTTNIRPLSKSSLDNVQFSTSFSVGGHSAATLQQSASSTNALTLASSATARWLYRRCVDINESHDDALSLALRILNVVRQHVSDEEEETTTNNNAAQKLQQALFGVVKTAKKNKKLDLDLVFQVCERRGELMVENFEVKLRRIGAGEANDAELAAGSSGGDGAPSNAQSEEAGGGGLEAAAEPNEEVADAIRDQAHVDEQTTFGLQPSSEAVTVQPTAWKKPRSRHKRRSKDADDATASTIAAANDQIADSDTTGQSALPESDSTKQSTDDKPNIDSMQSALPNSDSLKQYTGDKTNIDTMINSTQGSSTVLSSDNNNFIGDIQILPTTPVTTATSHTVATSPNRDNLGIFTLPNIFQTMKKSIIGTLPTSAAVTAKKLHSALPTSTCAAGITTTKMNGFATSHDNLEMEDVHWSFKPSEDDELVEMNEVMSPDRRLTRSMMNSNHDEDAKSNKHQDKTDDEGKEKLSEKDDIALSSRSSGTVGQSLSVPGAVAAASSLLRRSTRSPNTEQSPVSLRRCKSSPSKVAKAAECEIVREGVLEKERGAASSSPSRSTRSARSASSSSPGKIGRNAVKSVMFDEPVQHESNSSNKREGIKDNGNNDGSTVPNLSSVLKPKSRSSPRKNHISTNEDGEVYKTSDSSHSAVSRPRRKRSDRRGPVRVMFTGFNPTQRHKEMLQSLGAELIENVEDASSATHIIVSDGNSKLRRTPKLMICLSRVSKILNIEWLEQSFRQQQLLETEDYLHVNDTEAEKRYNFSMAETIQNGMHARRDRGGVLGGKWVYICRGVAGNQAPSAKELRLIVEAAGGNLLPSFDSSEDFDPCQTVILTSDPRTQSQLNENGVEEQMRNGANACTTSWLFHTIITQQLTGLDDLKDKTRMRRDQSSPKLKSPSKSRLKNPQVSSLVRCSSHESLVSTLTASPMKGVERRKRYANQTGDASVCSYSSRGSKVSNLEYANAPSPMKKRRAEAQTRNLLEGVSKQCDKFLARREFISEFSPSTEPFTKDAATIQTHTLWLNYFKDLGSRSTTPKVVRVGKGVRCRRGRKNSLSPLVTCTLNPEMATPAAVATPKLKNKARQKPSVLTSIFTSLPEHHEHVSWEAYVLFTLGSRAASLSKSQKTVTGISVESYFPKPVSISIIKHKLSLSVSTIEEYHNQTNQQIFGTLQDLFDLHRKHQYGHIHESVLARLAIQALEAVSAMHACRVAHNDLSLDSFLIVKSSSDDVDSEDDWHIQIIGFGYNSIVLDCQHQESISCNGDHFGHDYSCLSNVIHLLLTGGMPIALVEVFGHVEFATKTFIKSNLFLRGALSWCALLDALMCTGDKDFDTNPIQVGHPLDMFDVKEFDTYPKCRKSQISWSCRMLHEISSTNISLSSFVKGLCRYNPRFILPSVPPATFSFGTSDIRQSFILCQPPDAPASSHSGTKDSNNLQAHLSERKRALAHREATFHSQLQSIEDALQGDRALRNSNIEAERRIRKKEGDVLRREEEVAVQLRHIEKLKEELLAKERLLELRMRGDSNGSPSSDDESVFYNHQQSPCHSTEARSSVYAEVNEYETSDGGKKRRKRREGYMPATPNRHSSMHVQPSVSKASEHLCSLQNLGSPAFKGMQGSSSSSITKIRKKLNNSPEGSSVKSKRTPKKVFIDMNVDD